MIQEKRFCSVKLPGVLKEQEIHGLRGCFCKFRRHNMLAGLLVILLLCMLVSCSNIPPVINNTDNPETFGTSIHETSEKMTVNLINTDGGTVQERINVPDGFTRIEVEDTSFEHYLRALPLKPHGSEIKLFNGETKNSDSHAAILDIDVGDRDLQQCADAVMRLRAEYLYSRKLYEKIHFNFTSGFKADFTTWMSGNSIKVAGNDVQWVRNSSSTGDYDSFRKYLNMVFAYAGTLSLSKEMTNIPLKEMKAGDIFIKGATPGHTVIILDMAQNESTGEKIFLLAQSYMPAQDIHILKNLENDEISPWYSADINNTLVTPDWVFEGNQLMRFE